MPYCFPRSSIKFHGHTGQNITDFDPNWAFPDYRPVAAFKSLRFALFVRSFHKISEFHIDPAMRADLPGIPNMANWKPWIINSFRFNSNIVQPSKYDRFLQNHHKHTHSEDRP